MDVPSCIPLAMYETSSCPISLITFDIVNVLQFSHSIEHLVVIHSVFNVQFIMTNNVKTFFIYLLVICIFIFVKSIFIFFLQFLMGYLLFKKYDFKISLYIYSGC